VYRNDAKCSEYPGEIRVSLHLAASRYAPTGFRFRRGNPWGFKSLLEHWITLRTAAWCLRTRSLGAGWLGAGWLGAQRGDVGAILRTIEEGLLGDELITTEKMGIDRPELGVDASAPSMCVDQRAILRSLGTRVFPCAFSALSRHPCTATTRCSGVNVRQNAASSLSASAVGATTTDHVRPRESWWV